MSIDGITVSSGPLFLEVESVVRAAKETIARLESVGIAVSKSSRLPTSQRLIERSHDRRAPDPENRLQADAIADALLTIMDFFLIAHTVAPNHAPDDQVSKIRVALSGAPKETDHSSTLARDIQFELVLGAWIAKSGGRVHLAEPDLRMFLVDDYIGIAAKRVSSGRKIEKRMRAAINQIKSSRRCGVIALNLDRVVRGIGVQSRPCRETHGILDDVPGLYPVKKRLLDEPLVMGRLCVARGFTWVENEPFAGLAMSGDLKVESWLGNTLPEQKVTSALASIMKGITKAATEI
jgi:hypothetical protein